MFSNKCIWGRGEKESERWRQSRPFTARGCFVSAQQACTAGLPEVRGSHGLRASRAKGSRDHCHPFPLQKVHKPAKTGLTECAGPWDHEAGHRLRRPPGSKRSRRPAAVSGTEGSQAGHAPGTRRAQAPARTQARRRTRGKDTDTSTNNAHSRTPRAGTCALTFKRTHVRSHTGPSTGVEPGMDW